MEEKRRLRSRMTIPLMSKPQRPASVACSGLLLDRDSLPKLRPLQSSSPLQHCQFRPPRSTCRCAVRLSYNANRTQELGGLDRDEGWRSYCFSQAFCLCTPALLCPPLTAGGAGAATRGCRESADGFSGNNNSTAPIRIRREHGERKYTAQVGSRSFPSRPHYLRRGNGR